MSERESDPSSGRVVKIALLGGVGILVVALGVRAYVLPGPRSDAHLEPFPGAPPGASDASAGGAGAAASSDPIEAKPSELPGKGRGDLRQYEARVLEAEREVKIELFGTAPECREARAWLDRERLTYEFRDTESAVNKRALRTLNPAATTPTFNVDGHMLVGFSSQRLRSAIRTAAEYQVGRSGL